MEKYTVSLIKEGRIASITLPFNAKEVYKKDKGFIYVRGMLNHVPYRLKVMSKGQDKQMLIINKALQKKLGFLEGHMTLELTIEEAVNQDDFGGQADLVETCSMDVLKAIVSRRSIRTFKADDLSQGQVMTLLNAGLCAPSAKNKRPLDFIVIRDQSKLDALAGLNTNHHMVDKCKCCIVVCGDTVKQGIRDLLIEDCSAATQNILLAAHGLGLGGVWCGLMPRSPSTSYLSKTLDLPDSIHPIAMVALGYPDEKKAEVSRFDGSRIHREVW